jgi:hypothetical protein
VLTCLKAVLLGVFACLRLCVLVTVGLCVGLLLAPLAFTAVVSGLDLPSPTLSPATGVLWEGQVPEQDLAGMGHLFGYPRVIRDGFLSLDAVLDPATP